MLHAANIMAEYLDNNDDGVADNQQVVARLQQQNATLIMARDEADLEAAQGKIAQGVVIDALQDLRADEVFPNGAASGQFDASLEEVLHLITHVGYSGVYPDIFGETLDSSIADAMDKARGGRFEAIPANYPENAWYTYDDQTCDYACMVTEYTYWALTSMLGGQDFSGRLAQIQQEWRLNTQEKVRTQDPDVYAILSNPAYILPTILPDGDYSSSEFTIETNEHTMPTVPPGNGEHSEILQAAVAGNPNYKIAFTHQDKVMMMSADGSDVIVLADASPMAGYVSWGPEANFVYFASAKGTQGSAWEAFRVNVDTKELQQLSKFGNDVRSLGVSPDGQYLAISIMSGNSNIGNNNDNLTQFHTDLFVTSMSDAEDLWARGEMLLRDNMQALVSSPAASQFWYEELSWSPTLATDGLPVLAYSKTYRYDDDANSYTHVYNIKADGSGMAKIAENKDQPIFSIEGDKLTFLDKSYYDLALKQIKQLVVTGINQETAAPAISPDGNFMIFEVGDEDRRLGMARVSEDADNPGVVLEHINGYEPRWSPKPVESEMNNATGVIGATSEDTCKTAAENERQVCFIIQQDKAYMYGVIGSRIVETVNELIRSYPAVERIVLVNVPGSMDDEANLSAAKLVFDKGLNTQLLSNSDIASGGVDFFLAGNKRVLAKGANIGVHSWASEENGKLIQGKDLPRDHSAHKPYIDFYQYIQMQAAAEFYFFTLEAAPAQSIHYMRQEEIDSWKLAR